MCPLDLSETESILKATSLVRSRFGKIDFLINNGGISQRSTILETQLEVDRRIMEVNYFGSITITKSVLPAIAACTALQAKFEQKILSLAIAGALRII